jgi:hypothetical protein
MPLLAPASRSYSDDERLDLAAACVPAANAAAGCALALPLLLLLEDVSALVLLLLAAGAVAVVAVAVVEAVLLSSDCDARLIVRVNRFIIGFLLAGFCALLLLLLVSADAAAGA